MATMWKRFALREVQQSPCGWILIRIETVLCVKPVGLRGAAAYGGGHEHEALLPALR